MKIDLNIVGREFTFMGIADHLKANERFKRIEEKRLIYKDMLNAGLIDTNTYNDKLKALLSNL